MMFRRKPCRRNHDRCEPVITVSHLGAPRFGPQLTRHVQRCTHCRRPMGVALTHSRSIPAHGQIVLAPLLELALHEMTPPEPTPAA